MYNTAETMTCVEAVLLGCGEVGDEAGMGLIKSCDDSSIVPRNGCRTKREREVVIMLFCFVFIHVTYGALRAKAGCKHEKKRKQQPKRFNNKQCIRRINSDIDQRLWKKHGLR